jgi:terminase large subunit-like protein
MANSFAAHLADALENSWPAIARPNQLPPPRDWQVWLLLAGRGFGKTRTLAEWVCQQTASGQASRIALVAATAADARDVLVEGQSGILAVAPPWFRPVYEPSKRRLTWPNGAMATTFSAEEPERLRGPQHDAAVCDELGSWSRPETWDMLQFGLRLGGNPRCLVATTPRPTKLIRELLAREGRDVVVTRGSTYENRANLAPGFFDQVIRKYEGTRLGRQELLGPYPNWLVSSWKKASIGIPFWCAMIPTPVGWWVTLCQHFLARAVCLMEPLRIRPAVPGPLAIIYCFVFLYFWVAGRRMGPRSVTRSRNRLIAEPGLSAEARRPRTLFNLPARMRQLFGVSL